MDLPSFIKTIVYKCIETCQNEKEVKQLELFTESLEQTDENSFRKEKYQIESYKAFLVCNSLYKQKKWLMQNNIDLNKIPEMTQFNDLTKRFKLVKLAELLSIYKNINLKLQVEGNLEQTDTNNRSIMISQRLSKYKTKKAQ